MRNLLCVIGRHHDWQAKHDKEHDKEGRSYEIADERGVITFEVTTLGRAGRIGTKTVTHRCPLQPRPGFRRRRLVSWWPVVASRVQMQRSAAVLFRKLGPGIAESTAVYGY